MQRKPLVRPAPKLSTPVKGPYGVTDFVHNGQPTEDDEPDNLLEALGGPGRPDIYRRAYNKIVRNMRLLGYTVNEIAEVIGVHPVTLAKWRGMHEGFAEAWWSGGEVADGKVARALYKRAIGYHHPETKLYYDKDRGGVIEHEVIKYYPPDTAAGQYWLNNRQGMKWRNANNTTTLTDSEGRDVTLAPSVNVMVIDNRTQAAAVATGTPPTINAHVVNGNGADSHGV